MTERSGRAAIRMAGLAAVLAVVVIWPSPPVASEQADQIVTGFLEAARSGSANLSIADAYLTSAAQAKWKSEQNTVIVLADNSQTYPQQAGQGTSSAQESPAVDQQDAGGSGFDAAEQVQGDLIGEVGSSGLYSAKNGAVTYAFGLDYTKNGFRIASLPDGFGVLMERSDFESSYSRHDVYFENAQYDGALIPTQIYLPAIDTDQDLANAMTRFVVQGAADRPGAGVQDSLRGAVLKGVQLQNDGSATVTIDSREACVKDGNPCHLLSQQLLATLNSMSTKVTSVTVTDQANNKPYPSDSESSQTSYGVSPGTTVGRTFHAIADDGTVEVESVGAFGSGSPNPLAYGPAKTKFKQVALDPVQSSSAPQLALVSQDGTRVYVPRKQDGSGQLTQVYPSSSGRPGGTVGALSWDAYGVLWFTVAQGGTTEVYRYGQDSLSQVVVSGLEGRITQVAAAPDGSRVAVAYKDSTGGSWIKIGAVASEGDSGWLLQLNQAETVAADWSQITDFDWYNEDSLAILGIQPDSRPAASRSRRR